MTRSTTLQRIRRCLSAATLLAAAGVSQAALISLGDGTVRDTNTNLIWLQDWNVNGAQTWSTQRDWALGLDFAGSTDWRLPEIGEYVALFGAYGILTAVTDFTNVQSDFYWTGREAVKDRFASVVHAEFGSDGVTAVLDQFFAVAVRPSTVTAPVPEPQTLALALLALFATAAVRRPSAGT